MTNRHAGYVVILNQGIREDDAENTIDALKMIKGVLTVEPVEVDLSLQISKALARSELERKVMEVFYPDLAKQEKTSK